MELWKEEVSKIVLLKRSLDDLVTSHDLNEDEDLPLETVNTLVDQLVKEVQNTSETVEKEDRQRKPYTLDHVRTD